MKYRDKLDQMTDAELIQEGRRILKQADRAITIAIVVVTVAAALTIAAVVINLSS